MCFSGGVAIDLVSNFRSSAKIVSSPFIVRFNSPSTPTMSPKSRHWARAKFSSPTWALPIITWMVPVQSRICSQWTLPEGRRNTIRPAARTFGPCCSGGWSGLAVAGRLDGDFALPAADVADRLMPIEAGAPGVDA